MSKKQVFGDLSPEQEQAYSEEAARRWDAEKVRESNRLWKSCSAEKKQQIKDEGSAIYSELVEAMDQGAASAAVQALIARWHQHLRCFYEPRRSRAASMRCKEGVALNSVHTGQCRGMIDYAPTRRLSAHRRAISS